MRDTYIYRKTVHRYYHSVFKRRLFVALVLLLVVAVVAAAVYLDLSRSNSSPKKPVSGVSQQEISDSTQTFRSAYFEFSDRGKWVLKEDESNGDKYVYYKYRGLNIEHRLIVYVNQVPIPLYLAVSRALPVRIVNNNSLDVTNVSNPCVGYYGTDELHKIRIVSIEEAEILCDPDTSQYTVVLSKISGNYQLPMRRSSGQPIQFVVTYRDMRLDPDPFTIRRIAASFQTL